MWVYMFKIVAISTEILMYFTNLHNWAEFRFKKYDKS